MRSGKTNPNFAAHVKAIFSSTWFAFTSRWHGEDHHIHLPTFFTSGNSHLTKYSLTRHTWRIMLNKSHLTRHTWRIMLNKSQLTKCAWQATLEESWLTSHTWQQRFDKSYLKKICLRSHTLTRYAWQVKLVKSDFHNWQSGIIASSSSKQTPVW